MKKRSQELRTLDLIKLQGYVTNRQIINMGINNPYERIRKLRESLNLPFLRVKATNGTRFNVIYLNKRKARNYIRVSNLQLV